MIRSPSVDEAQQEHTIWSRSTVGWMLYDLANTIFSLNILSMYFSLWVVNDMGGSDQLYANTSSFSMLLMFLSAPIIGALSDMARTRMPFLIFSTVICALCTVLLGQGGLITALGLFIIANYFFQAGLIFYDALLPAVSNEESRGRVSGLGVALGYLGSFVGLGVGRLLLEFYDSKIPIFQATGVLFLIFAVPCFLFVRERPRTDARPITLSALSDAMRSVKGTFHNAGNYPGLRRFLIGRALYTDPANTVILFMGIYVTNELGFDDKSATTVLAVGIGAAVIGGLLWGQIVDRLGPKRTLDFVLILWMATLFMATILPLTPLPPGLFFVTAAMAGIALGGTWASDRPLMLRLSPPRYLGQFYGLYAMVGRFTAVTGPFTWGIIVDTLGWGRPAAIFSNLLMIVLAFYVLRPLDDQRRDWAPEELIPH